MKAIVNFWELEDKHPSLFSAIHEGMEGDAYHKEDIKEAMRKLDMSNYNYIPVLSDEAISVIEEDHNVKLMTMPVRKHVSGLYVID